MSVPPKYCALIKDLSTVALISTYTVVCASAESNPQENSWDARFGIDLWNTDKHFLIKLSDLIRAQTASYRQKLGFENVNVAVSLTRIRSKPERNSPSLRFPCTPLYGLIFILESKLQA